MKEIKIALPAAVIIALLAVIPMSAVASETPPPPFAMSLYGNITLDGEPAPVGTEITAEISGALAGKTTVDQEGVFGEKPWGRFVVNGQPGDSITIKVNGFEVGKLIDKNGDEITFTPGLVLTVDIYATTPDTTSDTPNTAVVTGRRGGGGGGGTYYPGDQQQTQKTDKKQTTQQPKTTTYKTTTKTKTTKPSEQPTTTTDGDEKGGLLMSLFGLFLPSAGAGTMLTSWTILISIVSTAIYLLVRRRYLG